ncbi:NUDIX domain-containing protein [Candidatus Kaiserbacteria bacterium]|nr:NUDIX domain-containing protein [Candidatus Kaiserbacteria bacterium]
MQIQVDSSVIKQLIFTSGKDGIQKQVVGAIIKLGDKFLLLEREQSDFMGGLVELPSGTVDDEEDLVTALAREVEEETGLTVRRVLSYVSEFDYMSGSGKKTRQFNFLVETEPGEIRLDPAEHQAFHLVSVKDEEFNTLNISDETRNALFKANA